MVNFYFIIISFTLSVALTCSNTRKTIRLNSTLNAKQFVEKGCIYTFIFDQSNCSRPPTTYYCTKNGSTLNGNPFFNHTEKGFNIHFQDFSISGILKCTTVDALCFQLYTVEIFVYVSPKDVQILAHEEMDQNLVPLVGPRTTNYSCCSNGMTPPAEIMFFLEDELMNGSTATTVTKHQENTGLYEVCSYAAILLSWQHDRKNIYCKVYQPQINYYKETEVQSALITLTVVIEFYHQTTLTLGYSVTEYESLALNCSSNYPFGASYTWKHEESDKVVASGIIMNNTNITCTEAGHYVCTLNPDNERNCTNVKTIVYVSCLPRQPVNSSVLELTENKIIFEWSPSPGSGNQTHYIIEWKNIDSEIIGNQTLPIPDKSPPFRFTIEDINISAVFMIGIYGKNENGKTESVIIYTSTKTTDSPAYTSEGKTTSFKKIEDGNVIPGENSTTLLILGISGIFATVVLCLMVVALVCNRTKKAGTNVGNPNINKSENIYDNESGYRIIRSPTASPSDNPGPSTSNKIGHRSQRNQDLPQTPARIYPRSTRVKDQTPESILTCPRRPKNENELIYVDIDHKSSKVNNSSKLPIRNDPATIYADLDIVAMKLIEN